jgi:queuine tRNA-ribosyltransferase
LGVRSLVAPVPAGSDRAALSEQSGFRASSKLSVVIVSVSSLNEILPAQHANAFSAQILKRHTSHVARVVQVETPHGVVLTPCFMPVGTHAAVSVMTPDALWSAGVQMILGGNTYHMMCSPGLDLLRSLGGMHAFMGWHGPMLTDSGGYQIFSLSRTSKHCLIDDEGARFQDPTTGQTIRLDPASSIEAQKILGADIIMALDQCTQDTGNRELVEAAMRRTHHWLASSREVYERNPYSEFGLRQALFGIIQGGPFRDLRERSAEFVVSQDLDGIAIGGETIGYNIPKTMEILSWLQPLLPEAKLRYTMGVGLGPQDLLDVVAAGVDMFDCVAPTRNARHGSLYCGRIVRRGTWLEWQSDEPKGRINLNNSRFATDERPIHEQCGCSTCKLHSRAYLRYLLKRRALAFYSLASVHNVYVMQQVCLAMRSCILDQEGAEM